MLDDVLPQPPPAEDHAGRRSDVGGFAGWFTRRVPAELRLCVVGGHRIEVAAIGNFDAHSIDRVAARLNRLVAGGPGCLSINCRRVTAIEDDVVEVFVAVRDRLRSVGGTLEVIDAPPTLSSALGADGTTPRTVDNQVAS